jgi:hypothetical protein
MPDTETFVVIESTPGYMPDDCDPFETDDYSAACEYANELADQLEEQGYVCDRGLASSGNYLAIHCELPREQTVAPDLGRFIAVERCEN